MRRFICMILLILFFTTGCARQANPESSPAPSLPPLPAGTISLYMAAPDTLHPLYTKQASNAKIYNLIYDSLIHVENDLLVSPRLAKSCTVSADCKSIAFTLKSDITWHDGSPFTAADVKHTFDIIMNPASESPYKDRLQKVSGVVQNDDLQFTVLLSEPYSRILALLDFPIVPAHRSDLDQVPCGTGQYKFEDLQPKKYMRLSKNTLWNISEVPIESNIQVKILEDTTDLVSALKMGEISAVNFNASDIASIGYLDNVQILKHTSLKYEFLGFNFSSTVFSDLSVRHAVSSAINRTQILKDVYFDYGSIANTPIPPAAYFANKEADKSEFQKDSYKEIFSEGGWGDADYNGIYDKGIDGVLHSVKGTILVNDDNPFRVSAAQQLSSQLLACGMDISVEAVPWDNYYERLQTGNYSIFLGGVDFSPNLDYSIMLSERPIGHLNFMNYSSPDMDAAIVETYKAATTEDSKNAFLSFQYVFTRDMPVTGLYFLDDALLYSQRIGGVLSPCVSGSYCSINKWHFKTHPSQ